MPAVEEFRATDGFGRVVVHNDTLRCEFIPELGAKIAQIHDQRNGRDWLWRHPRLAYAHGDPATSYVERADTGGWDECFPTVGACRYPALPWHDVVLPDHGELWCQTPTWSIDVTDTHVVCCSMWHGIGLPYRFERRVTIGDSSAMQFDYAVVNDGDADMHWIWCAHPLVALEPGMALNTPTGTTFWHVDYHGAFVAESSRAITISPTSMLDLQRLPPQQSGVAAKLYSAHLAAGWVQLIAHNGCWTMEWDTHEVPQLALWLNAGAWSNDGGTPYYNMGIEPAIGVYDALSDAYARTSTYATLAAGQQRCWRVHLQLDADTQRRSS
ncbi:MAG: hypothetical protein FJ040_05740 [Chloroflexi bacterium]|nr:hypothetical protein [Chloroflexota bacterium]